MNANFSSQEGLFVLTCISRGWVKSRGWQFSYFSGDCRKFVSVCSTPHLEANDGAVFATSIHESISRQDIGALRVSRAELRRAERIALKCTLKMTIASSLAQHLAAAVHFFVVLRYLQGSVSCAVNNLHQR